ncbi:MAG: winged helix DNA-binding domain-containing protein, partial [Candidatus Methanoperedens sp.]|nr:winged helix DNA-binding domain-containing protein [Candidatus Methanoperedens sp.]
KIIRGRGLTTKDIKKELGTALNVSLIVNLMCDQGLLIRGIPKAGWKSNIHTYYPFYDYFSDLDVNAENEANARNLIVKQYLASFGPVTENDITWWTGFPKGEIRRIIENLRDHIIQLEISNTDGDYFLLNSDEKPLETVGLSTKQTVNLLPVLDPYIMGYKERKRYLDYNYYDKVFDFNGNATSTILVDGKIIGVWDFVKEKKPFIKIYFFEKLESNVLTEVFCSAEKIGRFIIEREVEIKECKSMVPLTHRTAGGFMSPLKEC